MSTKHTPGKWHVDIKQDMVYCDEIKGNIVCYAPVGMTNSMEYWEANARLIAAAPDMLELIKKYKHYIKKAPLSVFQDIDSLLKRIEP